MKILIVILVFAFSTGLCQNGSNDTSFNPVDKGFNNGSDFNDYVLTTAVQNDGKIIVGGAFTMYKSNEIQKLCRLLPNGDLDHTFKLPIEFISVTSVYDVALQCDGKIIAGCSSGIIRLNSDGTKDTTFRGTLNSGDVLTLMVEPDGKILAGGDIGSYKGNTVHHLMRLLPNGDLDSTFNTGIGFNDRINKIVKQGNRYILGGNFSNYNNTSTKYIAAVNEDGSLDENFKTPDFLNAPVTAISIQTDNRILIGGSFSDYILNAERQDTLSIKGLIRLNQDGSLDTSFNCGKGIDSPYGNIYVCGILNSDNGVCVYGSWARFNGHSVQNIFKLKTNGTLDTTFKMSPEFKALIRTVSALNSGKLMIGGTGTSESPKRYAVVLNANGNVDSTFNPKGTGFDNPVRCLATWNKKIIAVGEFSSYNGQKAKRIIRLDLQGNADNTFKTGQGFDDIVETVTIQADDKILVAGEFTGYNGIPANKIARLNPDGSLDTTFRTPSVKESVFALAVQKDNKILVGCNGDHALLRLNQDGSADTTFKLPGFTESFIDEAVFSIVIQNDGKIIAGGAFFKVNGIERNNIVRLYSNGEVDISFNNGKANPDQGNCTTDIGCDMPVHSVIVDDGGFIYLSGDFTVAGLTRKNRIMRLTPGGALDSTFETGYYGTDAEIKTITLIGNRILAGGAFTKFYSTNYCGLACVNMSGQVDHSLETGSGFQGDVNSILFTEDNEIIVAGSFTSYNGIGRNRIAKLKYTPETNDVNKLHPESKDIFSLYPNPTKESITVSNELGVDRIKIYNTVGTLIFQLENTLNTNITTINVSSLKPGTYFVQIENKQAYTKQILIIL